LFAVVGIETFLSHQLCTSLVRGLDLHHRNTSFLACCNLPSALSFRCIKGRLTLIFTGTKTLGFVVVASGTEVESSITLITTFTLVDLVITPKTGVTRAIIVPSTMCFSAVILVTVGPSFKGRVGIDSFEFISSHQGGSDLERSDRGKSQNGWDGREGTEEGGEDSHRKNRL
jgi:hypothetical protein